jgi:hypothetical protein
MNKFVPIVSLSLLTLFAFSACDTPGHSALAGAATGAAVGGLATCHGEGALVGAAIGAGTGYLIGKQVQADRRAAYDQGYYDGRYADDGSGGPGPGHGYPLGRFTDRQGVVTSPYPPYNNIDVRDIPRGAKVQDPSTGKIFINP